jgi:acetyl-CoA carboxylase biotin carboxyl carrier protein
MEITALELLVERDADGDGYRLCAPDAGLFTDALPLGAAVAPGQPAGSLLRLGRAVKLVVPAGVHGRVLSDRPERVHKPVGHGTTLYELTPFTDDPTRGGTEEDEAQSGALVLRSPQSGRFYQRPGPGEPPYVEAGTMLKEGRPLGLIEVMKTFTVVPYHVGGTLPAEARVVRYLADDGADVGAGEPLIELEEA